MQQQLPAVNASSDVAAPTVLNGSLQSVRLTMRDALLVRADSGVKVLAAGGGQYAARIPITILGQTMALVRGFNWADVRAGSKEFRVVNTHLESERSDVAYAGSAADAARRLCARSRPMA
jgi:hypothetical protein